MARGRKATMTTTPGGGVRLIVWIGHIALPLGALWLLIAQPSLDLRWEHRPSHFWLVMGVAAINVALALQVLRAARLRRDARLLLAGFAFMVAAGFLLLHALATPGVILSSANGGFEIATPVGLALASLFFISASMDFPAATSQQIVDRADVTRLVLIVVMAIWGMISVAGLAPLDESLVETVSGPLRWVAVVSIGLYLTAAFRFYLAHRRKSSVMLVALITAASLLAEAMATIIWARSWQLSWWLWHLLMAAAFGFVAYSAYSEYRREGGSAGIFDGIVSRHTAETIREEYGGALETLTETLRRSATSALTDDELDLIIVGLRTKFSLTEGQTEVLARAARALATEREQTRRLGALAHIGTELAIERGEEELLGSVLGIVADSFSPDVVRIGLRVDDGLVYPPLLATGDLPRDGDRYSKSLVVGTEDSGVVEFLRPTGKFRSGDLPIMDTLVAEIGIALENVRLYGQVDSLFRTYLSPDVADALRADPSRAGLGGSAVDLTALFADMRGFTSFSERSDPGEVMAMLNQHFGAAVPVVLRNGGTIVQFMGDAILAVFDAPRPRADHAFRAARSALEMQEAITEATRGIEDPPRFRIGINTGPAVIGNLGSAEMRSFTVVGDAVNVASRLETSADPGAVVVGESTYRLISDRVEAVPLGHLELKGKQHPTAAYRLERIIGD